MTNTEMEALEVVVESMLAHQKCSFLQKSLEEERNRLTKQWEDKLNSAMNDLAEAKAKIESDAEAISNLKKMCEAQLRKNADLEKKVKEYDEMQEKPEEKSHFSENNPNFLDHLAILEGDIRLLDDENRKQHEDIDNLLEENTQQKEINITLKKEIENIKEIFNKLKENIEELKETNIKLVDDVERIEQTKKKLTDDIEVLKEDNEGLKQSNKKLVEANEELKKIIKKVLEDSESVQSRFKVIETELSSSDK